MPKVSRAEHANLTGVRNSPICHVFQTDDADSPIPLCATKEPFTGGLQFHEGLRSHKDPTRCTHCRRPTCQKCDEAALLLQKKQRLARSY